MAKKRKIPDSKRKQILWRLEEIRQSADLNVQIDGFSQLIKRVESGYQRTAEVREILCEIYSFRGWCYDRLKEWDEALKDYSKAIELGHWEKIYGVHLNRGNIHVELRQWKDALKDYQKAVKLKPDLSLPYRSWEECTAGLEKRNWPCKTSIIR